MPKKNQKITRWVRRHQGKHFCKCGCGETIEVKRIHYRPSVGIPNFIVGHNLTLEPDAEPILELPKQSGWDKLSDEEKERRLSQLKSFESGEKNPAWKGGRMVDEKGYVYLLTPDHPFARDGYMAEHRLVVEERTRGEDPNNPLLVEVDGKKYLKPSAVVHHIDEIKDNNKSRNLMLLPGQQFHSFLHNSPLPMNRRLYRIAIGVCHSNPLDQGKTYYYRYPWILKYINQEESNGKD